MFNNDKMTVFRKKSGLTQTQLAARANMTKQQWSQYETGKRREPRANQKTRIANALGVTVRAIWG